MRQTSEMLSSGSGMSEEPMMPPLEEEEPMPMPPTEQQSPPTGLMSRKGAM